MPPEVEQDVLVTVELPVLPLAVYSLVAQALPHEDLRSLRLVSRAWSNAANGAVRSLNKRVLTIAHRDNFQTAVHRFPGISSINLAFVPGAMQYMKILMPLTSLQSICLDWIAASSPTAWKLLQRQACLTSLRVGSLWSVGVHDEVLQSLPVLGNLKKLDISLNQLVVTDAGIKALSQLVHLESLRLPVSKYAASFSGSSANVSQHLPD